MRYWKDKIFEKKKKTLLLLDSKESARKGNKFEF